MAPQSGNGALVIEGGHRLRGEIAVSGSKNATMGAMAAALLVREECILDNVPRIGDVEHMAQVLRSLGVAVEGAGAHPLRINADGLHSSSPPTEQGGSVGRGFLRTGEPLRRLGA